MENVCIGGWVSPHHIVLLEKALSDARRTRTASSGVAVAVIALCLHRRMPYFRMLARHIIRFLPKYSETVHRIPDLMNLGVVNGECTLEVAAAWFKKAWPTWLSEKMNSEEEATKMMIEIYHLHDLSTRRFTAYVEVTRAYKKRRPNV